MPNTSTSRAPEDRFATSPELVDTHCHLDDQAFADDLPDVLARARAGGVNRWINVGYAPDRWQASLALVGRHAGMSCMLGVHPGHANEWSDRVLAQLQRLIETHRLVAIGEIGLDFFRGETNHAIQVAAFRAQLALARKHELPAVIHMRNAEQEILDVLHHERELPPLLFHSYDGSDRLTDWVLTAGAYIGVGGLATRGKSVALHRQIKRNPIDRIVLETDAPYLVPNGFKHRRNTPESLPVIARFLAGLLGMDSGLLARQTTSNAERLFCGLSTNHAAGT